MKRGSGLYLRCFSLTVVLIGLCFDVHAVNETEWTWERCRTRAATNTLSRRTLARYREEAADFRVRAEERARWPQLTVSSDLGILNEAFDGVDPDILREAGLPKRVTDMFERDPTNHWLVRGEIKMPLYCHRDMQARYDYLLAQREEAAAIRTQTEAELRWELREQFIGLLFQQAMLEEHTAIQENRKQLLAAAESGYEAGLLSVGQLALHRSHVAEGAATLQQTAELLAFQLEILNDFLGLAPGQIQTVSGRLGCDPPPDLDAIASHYLLDETTETRIAGARDKQAQAQVEQLSMRFPHRWELLARARTVQDQYRQDNVDWFVGVRLTMSLFDGGQRQYQLRAARSDQALTDAHNEAERRTLEYRARRSLLNYRHAWIRKRAQADLVAAAARNATITGEEYKTGVGTFMAWQTAQTTYATQRLQLIELRHQAAKAQAAWERMLGHTLSGPINVEKDTIQ